MGRYLLSAIVLVLIAILFLFIKRNRVFSKIALDNTLGGIIFSGTIAIYSLILAFVVIVVWQQYQAAGDRIETEASKLFNVYRSTYGFKDSANIIAGDSIRAQIKNYALSVQEDEWPLMAIDSSSPKTQKINNNLLRAVNQVEPVTEAEKLWFAQTIHNLYQFSESRHTRLADRDYSIPAFLWVLLIAGAGVVIIFSMFLDSKNKWQHLAKILTLSTMIIFSLLLVNMLNHPFKGSLRLKPDAFQKIFVGNW
jgi:uncharacterized protein DUF4239